MLFTFLVACGFESSREWRSRHIERFYYGGIPWGIFNNTSHWTVSGKNNRDSHLCKPGELLHDILSVKIIAAIFDFNGSGRLGREMNLTLNGRSDNQSRACNINAP